MPQNNPDGSSPESRVRGAATHQVVSERLFVLHVLQAVLADPQLGLLAVVLGKRRKVPGVDLEVADLDLVHVFHLGDLRPEKNTGGVRGGPA